VNNSISESLTLAQQMLKTAVVDAADFTFGNAVPGKFIFFLLKFNIFYIF